ncbi:hypothetical protein ACHAWO_003664 [Cyclotella atomus]|uniref:Uncharacterized protein n=1 Tax=Cyclotella atomus TaxID=382360 RepID=A0ABD3PRI3_9STRA
MNSAPTWPTPAKLRKGPFGQDSPPTSKDHSFTTVPGFETILICLFKNKCLGHASRQSLLAPV